MIDNPNSNIKDENSEIQNFNFFLNKNHNEKAKFKSEFTLHPYTSAFVEHYIEIPKKTHDKKYVWDGNFIDDYCKESISIKNKLNIPINTVKTEMNDIRLFAYQNGYTPNRVMDSVRKTHFNAILNRILDLMEKKMSNNGKKIRKQRIYTLLDELKFYNAELEKKCDEYVIECRDFGYIFDTKDFDVYNPKKHLISNPKDKNDDKHNVYLSNILVKLYGIELIARDMSDNFKNLEIFLIKYNVDYDYRSMINNISSKYNLKDTRLSNIEDNICYHIDVNSLLKINNEEKEYSNNQDLINSEYFNIKDSLVSSPKM